MDDDELGSLLRKNASGNITPEEQSRLDVLVRQWASGRYFPCPVCRAGVSVAIWFESPRICPYCRTELESSTFDPIGHSMHDIDPSVPAEQRLSVFTQFVYPRGTQVCTCGEVYAHLYSCCPDLLAFAIDQTKSHQGQGAAIRFLDSHSETLLNCLRGRFASIFNSRRHKMLVKLANHLKCAEELKRCLAAE